MAFIEIEHLEKTYTSKSGDTEALKDVNFTIEKGEIFGVIGLSGAGKSTLVRCVNLLEKPSAGRVVIDGEDMLSLSERELRLKRRDIGMIFQHFNLLMQRTVLDNVCFPMEIAGMKKKEARVKALEYLEQVELADKAKAYPAQLSGGQKQRVAIARVLASRPRVLLCDEATSALDPQTTQSILQLLKHINEKYQITMIVITHEMRVVQQICDHVAVLEYGRIVESGRTKEVFDDPKTEAAKRLIYTHEYTELESEGSGI
ncbi:MAG: ATP-binding cassette domain-containing protein [Lachnospiraceae bacterium]|nr:ATP-binding cassette domain-containing protein [Lachnospiraceae bacterium]